ncbi:MAG: hypothetical protein WHS90_04540 [Caldilinea sp.]|uniref:hypothetical protein n=1 Tax=Caldilinea sp. TaxID=2293560 RepID=UPI0030A13ED1
MIVASLIGCYRWERKVFGIVAGIVASIVAKNGKLSIPYFAPFCSDLYGFALHGAVKRRTPVQRKRGSNALIPPKPGARIEIKAISADEKVENSVLEHSSVLSDVQRFYENPCRGG